MHQSVRPPQLARQLLCRRSLRAIGTPAPRKYPGLSQSGELSIRKARSKRHHAPAKSIARFVIYLILAATCIRVLYAQQSVFTPPEMTTTVKAKPRRPTPDAIENVDGSVAGANTRVANKSSGFDVKLPDMTSPRAGGGRTQFARILPESWLA